MSCRTGAAVVGGLAARAREGAPHSKLLSKQSRRRRGLITPSSKLLRLQGAPRGHPCVGSCEPVVRRPPLGGLLGCSRHPAPNAGCWCQAGGLRGGAERAQVGASLPRARLHWRSRRGQWEVLPLCLVFLGGPRGMGLRLEGGVALPPPSRIPGACQGCTVAAGAAAVGAAAGKARLLLGTPWIAGGGAATWWVGILRQWRACPLREAG